MADIKTNQSKVYNALKGMGFSGIGANEEEFAAKMNNPKNREKVYNALSSKGYKGIGKDQAAFDSLIYQAQQPTEKPVPTQPAEMPSTGNEMGADVGAALLSSQTQPQPQPAKPVEQPQQKKQEQPKPQPANQQGGYKPSDLDMMSFGATIGGAQYAVDNAAKGIDEISKASKKASPFGGGNVGLGNNQNIRKGDKTFDAEKGAFVDTYLTSDGRKFNDINQANQVQGQLDNVAADVRFNETMKSLGIDVEGDKDKDINHLLGDAYEELHQLEAKEQEIAKKESASRKGPRFPSMVGGPSETYTMSEESKNLSSAKRMLQRRIDALETARDKGGFWGGVGDVLTDPSSYSFGLTDLADAGAMSNISKKIEEARANGVSPQLTDSEKALARNYMLNQQAQGMNKDNFWYEMGQSFGQTLSFMKDFALTGGGFMNIAKAGMNLGAKGGAKLASKALGDYMTKNLGTKALGKTMEYMGKGLGLAAGAEVGGLALNNTAQAASSIADIMNKQMGNLTVGKDGNLSFEGSKSLGEAVLKSQLSRGGENASELVGLAFDAVPGILGRVIQKTKVGQFAKKIADSKYWKGYEKAMNYLGIQSVWGEGMEEEYNMARDVLIGESGWFKDPNDPNKPAFFDGEQQLKTWETVGITSMLLRVPSMIATGTQGANYYANQYNLNTSDRNMRSVFGDDIRYGSVKAMMDGADNAQLAGVLNNLMNNAQLSKEEKEAMFMYANDLVKLRGFNIGNVVAAAQGYREPPKVNSYAVKGNSFDELDAEGNVLAHHEYDTVEEMKAGLYEAQQTRFDDSLLSDISAMEARPNNQLGTLVQNYLAQAQLDMSPEEFEEIITKPSMARTDAEQQIATQFAKVLHDAVYDNTMLHEEQSVQDGESAAEEAAIDIENPDQTASAEIAAAWQAAQENRRVAFEKNEDLMQEVTRMENEGLSHQEIISALEWARPDEVNTMIDYYNQKARFEGYVNRMSQKIDEEAANSRQRHAFKGTINGTADLNNVYTITDGTNEYFLVSGNITTDPATGQITGSDSGLIIGMDLDGSFVNIGDTNGYSVMPPSMTLDQFEEQERTRLQEQMTATIDPTGSMQPQEQQTGEVGGEAGQVQTGANEPPTPEPAINRIPKDEGGNPLYEQASPEDTYDAFVEQVGENTAKILAKKQVDTATKALEKLNKKMEKGDFEGNTIQEQIASSQALQKQIDATQTTINYWNQVLAVPNNRMLNEANNRPTGGTIILPAAETPAGEAPEWRYDTPEAARQRGYKVVEGQRIDRQEEKPMPQGMEVEVQYSTKDKVKGRMTVSELGDVQGSHLTNGQVNEKHFLPEAQPKSEFGADRQAAAQTNASEENFRPELMLTFNGTQSAYSGSASQTNRRGEVIQGNGRRNLAEYIYAPGNEAVARRYKDFLKAHAEELGTTAEAIEQMEKPFAHIVLDVTDDEAIRLGQFTAADLESGGKKIPEVSNTITKLGDNYGSFSNILLRHEEPDATLAERVDRNMEDAINWLNRGGYINNTEAKTLLEDKDAARQFLKDMLTDVLFRGANPQLRTMFYELPVNIQNALVSVVGREVGFPPEVSLLKDIQESIQAYHELMASSSQFAGVKGNDYEARKKAADVAVEDWLRQINLDGSLNQGKFSNFALELAKLYRCLKDQKTLASRLKQYYDIMSGAPSQGNLFDAPAETGTMTREQALEQIFGIENGTQRTMPVAGNNQAGQRGSEGGTNRPQSGEREEGEGGPSDTGGGSTGQSPVGEGSPQVSEREKFIAEHPLTEAEIDAANASEAQKILAKQYLNAKDDFVSEMAKAAYTFIYNRKVAAQNKPQQGETKPAAPRNEAPTRTEIAQGEAPAEAPTNPPTPPTRGQSGGAQSSAKAAAQARMAAALAKLKKHGNKPTDNGTDAYSIENLTPEQIEDMFEVVEAGAELGYTLLDDVESKEDWIAQMREAIAEPLKDATGYNDTEVDELLNDMWNYPYVVGEQTKTVAEWAAEKGINVNEIENGTGESIGDNPSAELPGSGTVGGSTEVAVESGNNNEGQPESGGEISNGPVNGGSNSGTQSRGQANGGRQRTGGNGTTRSKTRGTGKSEEPGNLFGEDNGNETNDTPGVTTGGTAATVPESGIVVSEDGKAPKKPLADITQEKSPYTPASIGGKYAIGSVIPSGIVDSIANAFKRLKERFFPKKGSTLDFVREELGYKTNEEMLSDFESGKTDGLAAEQVDAVALAIGKMKEGKSFIVGDMTGVGKGRTAAALIRWGLKHGKKVLFVTEKSGLFSDMYRDLTDINSDYLPFVTNSDTDANITDADGNKVIPKPMPAAQKALWQSESDKLPRDKKGRQYDFVMTTYSQVNGNEKGDKKKAEWLKEYAKDAIVIMDESHNASGDSNTGAYFREVVENAGGVTFLSATYAKRPDNMLLYAIKSSMSAINMPVQSFLEAIKEYGVAMQELMASALFGSGEMIRRERDMSDVKTTWTDPREIYGEEEYEECRKTSDKTMALINDIIQFQRDHVNPIVADHEKDYAQQNALAALIGGVQTHAGNTSYKSQVSNIVNLMVYAMKAKKAAEMAIEQIKQGKKPVIAVSNTMGSYIDELDDDIPEANFLPIFEKGVKFALKYVIADYAPGDDGKYHKVKGSERIFNAEDELTDAGQRALDNLRQRIEEYFEDTDKVDLSLSPIDLVKQMIADAGYNCGEITGRSTQLVRKEGGGYQKTSIRQNKKEAARKFNGGSKDKPIPEDQQYQALILNVAGATGISLHSSKKFGNQQPRTMIILQPNADVNKEVQMRGRIDRTGQVHRGEYFYMSSPIPAEQKITMMLKQKLASLDAQSVGTKKVSSNKVEGQDMDNKYGDEVCTQYLQEHLNDVNAFLENGLQWNRKTREWEGRAGILYDVLKDLQRMPCEMQEKVIAELTQRYSDQIEYLNQNGINDLESTTMDLEAVVIDEATFVKGKDNDSENEFAHDTTIERVEVNVLKKPMRSSDIKKKMKELDALDEDGVPKEGILQQTSDKVEEANKKKVADRADKYKEQEEKLEEKIRNEHPQKADQTDEAYEEMVKNWPSLLEMKNKHKADLDQYAADLGSQYSLIYRAAMWLKPGRPYLVPLTDDVSDSAAMMYGRFLGFQMKNGDTRQVQAVFAVKDSRAMITVPVVNQNKVIERIIQDRYDMEIVALEKDENGQRKTQEEMSKTWDEWWDKMIPKNTNRQVRYMITGNVLQACGSLGKYKGQIITFSRKNPKTGEITLERGMLLAENFDPENFQVRRAVEKKDVWESYDEIKDDRSGVSCHREGDNMVVKFEKRKGEKLADHPAQKDQTLKDLAMNGEIRPSGKTALLCVIKENNVEKALEHLYKEYGYTKEELFVMPDSTEKPDAIVRTNRPWKDIIDEFSPKYGSNRYTVENKINQMLKRYKMDVNNDDLKQQIREAVQLRQAFLRKEYADQESNRLAWEVLILDEKIERYKDEKEYREDAMRRREAILEELEFRGFKGNAYHYEQGKITLDDVRKMFDSMNDESTPEGKAKKALFEKVMAKVSKLPMEIFLNEKIDNRTGGFAGGKIVNYNWKYMNADYIADQAKADTILHELIHTVTAYADRCVEDGLEHLLDQDMVDAINELHSIYDAIKNNPIFVHDGAPAYGLSNVREMLSEAGSNSEFREDLKKTGLWARLKAGFLAFFGIKKGVDMPGAKQVNAFEQIMERLDYLIENFKQEAWEEYYKGTQYGGYGYKRKTDAQKITTSDPMEAIEQAASDFRDEQKRRQNVKYSLEGQEKVNESNKNELPAFSSKKRSHVKGRFIESSYSEVLSEQSRAILERVAQALGYEVTVGDTGGVGAVWNGTHRIITISPQVANNGDKTLMVVFGHELTHLIKHESEEHPEVWEAYAKLAKEYVGEEEYNRLYTKFKEGYEKQAMEEGGEKPTPEEIEEEVCAEIGGTLFSDSKFAHDLLDKVEQEGGNAKSIAKRMLDFVKMLYDSLMPIFEEMGFSNQLAVMETTRSLWSDMFEYASAKSRNGNSNNESTQNKYHIGNTSDLIDAISQAADDFRDGQVNNPAVHSAKAVYNERLNRVETVFTEAYQDAMVSLKTAQNAIAKDQDIPDSQNAYMAENLMHGKNKNEQDLFNLTFRDPLIRTINKIMNLTGMNWGDVDRYVYTKSGLERNRELFVRDWLELERMKNKDDQAELDRLDDLEQDWLDLKKDAYDKLQRGDITYPEYLEQLEKFIKSNMENDYDPSEHDYSGFRSMFGDEDGDYDEADIIAELMDTEASIGSDNVGTLWEQINAATRYGLERYRQAGMRSDSEIDKIEQMFHFYVPMRGFKEDMGEDMYQYFTGKDKSKNYLGGLLKHAKGRGSEANYPISTIFAMSYKAIADCNQNLVNQKLYRLCQANPNDLVVLSDSWVKHDPITDTWVEVMPPITDDMNEEEVRQTTIDFENDMKALERQGEAKKIRGKAQLDYVPMDKKKKSEHIVEVRINGDKKLMIVTGNPRMAQALNGQLRFEHGKNVFSKWNSAIKNFMASVFTSYSPTFAMRNMLRDWTHFRTMLGVREGHGYAQAANKYYRQSLFKMVGLFKKYRGGTLDDSKQIERDFKDFMDEGGITGFVFMQKLDDIQKQMEKIYKDQKAGKTIRLNNNLWESILGAVEALNEGIENNARFATYRASRHYAGRTKARSAYDAKEITVNFNRKGAGGKTAGYKSQSKMVEDAAKAFGITSQILGEGRIFFNATVQAIATTFKNFQNPDGSLNKKYIAKWAAKYALPPFMFGLALPMINKALAAALGGDDGDDDPYANLAEWTRRKNLCFYIGNGNFITIPIGQELAAFLALGDMLAGSTYAPDLKPIDKNFADEMVGIMNTFSPVDIDTKLTKGGLMEDPVDETIGRTFSVLAPLVAVQQNLGWTGRPIYREDVYPNDQYSPEYQMVYSGTNPVLVGASKLANELSGGDDVTRGKIQVNPAIVQYLWEQYTGGPGKVFSNTISIGKDAKDILTGNDNDFNMRKVEGLKAFVQQGDDRTAYYRTQAKYRKYKADADELSYRVSGYEKAAAEDPAALLKLEEIVKGEDFVRMQIIKEAEKTLSQINKAANKAEGKERKELRQLYNQSVKEVVDLLDGVGKE